MKKQNKIIVIVLLCLISAFFSFSQNIDSLQNALKNKMDDTSRLNVLNQLVEIIDDDNVWPKYNQLAFDLSEKLAQSSDEKLRKIGKRGLGNALNNFGIMQQNLGNTKLALDYYTKCMVIQKEISDKAGVANTLNNIGVLAKIQGDIVKALDSWDKCLKIQEETGNEKGMANTLISSGYTHYELGDFQIALEQLAKSLRIEEKIDDKHGMANCLNTLGFISYKKGDLNKALKYHERSLKIREQIGDKRGIANSFVNLGIIFMDQGDDASALNYFLKSLRIVEGLKNKGSIANSLVNIGSVYMKRKDFPMALDFYNKSLILREEVGDKQGIANSLINMGTVYHTQGDIPKALVFYNKSLKIQKEIGDKNGIAFSFNNLGTIYLQQKKYNFAKAYFDSSLRISKEFGYPENIRNVERYLYLSDSCTKNYSSALNHYKQYILYRDSISNEANRKISFRGKLKYEYEKKEGILKQQQDKERIVAQEKNNFQKIVIVSVLVGLLLVIIFSIFIFRSLQQNKRTNKIITQQKEEVEKQKQVVDLKNEIIEAKQKEIIDSINYAKRIQYTLLAHDDFLKDNLNGSGRDHFVYFKPKDIVSGDFYWATKVVSKSEVSPGSKSKKQEIQKRELFYLAVCDSTGHGVPGAFMSLLNIGFLTEAINEKGIEKPNEIFNFVRKRLIDNISKEGQKDGFDGVLICIEKLPLSVDAIEKEVNIMIGGELKITYAAANNTPVLVSNGKLTSLTSDRMPVGMGERKDDFNLFSIDAKKGDTLYLYTDGFSDQFGGLKGKKFMYKKLNELILTGSSKSLNEQKQIFENTFESWKGALDQVDDVCIIALSL